MDSASLQFLGAAGSVTGSRYVVTVDGLHVLVDCGLFQEPDLEHRNREPLPIDPGSIDCVVLTHAHLDHSGYIPRLVRDGFRGPIWCTPATADLAAILWRDAASLELHDAQARERRHHRERRRGHSPRGGRRTEAEQAQDDEPLYREVDVERALRQVQTAEYGSTTRLARHLVLTFIDAGHILGAASVSLEWQNAGERLRLLFSGDLGRPDRPILHDPSPPPATDYLIVESTYGDRLHPADDVEDQLAEVINTTVERGGSVIIPSFAVQRAQEVLYYLRRLFEQRRIPRLPVFLDSPMASAVTRVFAGYTSILDPDIGEAYRSGRSPFDFPSLKITESADESRAINEQTAPHIVIAGSGMCDGGRVQHHLLHGASNPLNTILFVGFQAPGTLGRRITEGEPHVQIFGKPVTIRAQVVEVGALSAHADRDEIVAWLRRLPAAPRRVFVTHGAPDAAEALRQYVEETLGWTAVTPAAGEIEPLT